MAYVNRAKEINPDVGHGDWQDDGLNDACFYCGKLLFAPLIYWSGQTGEISMHPECAERLIIRLALDVYRWQCDPLV
jgi:hypothetical protein